MISMFAAPLIPMFIGMLLAFVGSLIVRKMRFKNVIVILLYIAAISVYFIFVSDSSKTVQLFIDNAAAIKDGISSYYFPAALFCNAMEGNILHALLLLAVGAVPILCALFLLSGVYPELVTAANNVSQSKKTKGALKTASGARTPLMTWLAKEFQHYFSSTTFLLNTISGPIMSVLLTVFVLSKSIFATITYPMAVMSGIVMVCMFPTTAASISLEGKRFWIIQSSPSDKKTVLNAKMLMSILVELPFILINSVLVCVIGGYAIADAAAYFIMVASAAVLASVLGLLINLWKPRLDYTSEVQVVKQSLTSFLAILGGTVIGGVAALLYLAARSFAGTYILRAAVVGGALLLVWFGLIRVLYTSGIKKFEKL